MGGNSWLTMPTATPESEIATLDAYKMSRVLYDNHGRVINYLRLAVTDRCNLRCFYCMPEEGIKYVPRDDLLTYEELLRFTRLMASAGISKVRITGGEPFVRKDMILFLTELAGIEGIESIHITTNGTITHKYIDVLKEIGIKSINLSLDSLEREKFLTITRRDEFENVRKTMDAILESGIPLKLNAVVMDGLNTDEIPAFVELTRDLPISVRFIEEMPFNGTERSGSGAMWNHRRILESISTAYPGIEKAEDPPFATASAYRIPGFKGEVGIIAAYSRSFCGTCNRIRVTPKGVIKTCLYDNGVFNVRDIIRSGASDDQIIDAVINAISHRAKDGWEAEERSRNHPIIESMSSIGG